MQGGSHAIYAISSLRNDELVSGGPNPFADVLAEWEVVDPVQPVMLLPPDAELDPAAVARLTPGAESPRQLPVAGDEPAQQPSRTSSVEAQSPRVPSALTGAHPYAACAVCWVYSLFRTSLRPCLE